MGMGYSANEAIVVNTEFVKDTVGDLYNRFLELLDDNDTDINEFAEAFEHDDLERFSEELIESMTAITELFQVCTGLRLSLTFHDQSEEGDRYDDFDGWAWVLDRGEVYVLSENAKLISDKFEEVSYVSFG